MISDLAKAQEEIIEIEKKIFVAIRTRDIPTLDEIVAEDFVFRGPRQPEIDKTEFLKSIKSFPIEILEIWSDDMQVNIYGDVALLTGVQQARTRDGDGKVVLSAGAFSDLFLQRDGRWSLVLAYNVELDSMN